MLSQDDFVEMLTTMQHHVARTLEITEGLIEEIDDKEIKYKLAAIGQTKRLHLDAMNALTTLLKGGKG